MSFCPSRASQLREQLLPSGLVLVRRGPAPAWPPSREAAVLSTENVPQHLGRSERAPAAKLRHPGTDRFRDLVRLFRGAGAACGSLRLDSALMPPGDAQALNGLRPALSGHDEPVGPQADLAQQRAVQVRRRSMPAAKELASLRFCWNLFCAASADHASICACLACNTL